MTTAALIVAAGRGSRAGGNLPKQYATLASRSVIGRTVGAFASVDEITWIQVVIHPDDTELYSQALEPDSAKMLSPVYGGATRQISVMNGLEALSGRGITKVLIHDAARPFVQQATICKVISALNDGDGRGALAAVPLADTLKRADKSGQVSETIPRENLWRAQTPQAFHYDDILAAHRKAAQSGHRDFTDDSALAEWAGIPVTLIEDDSGNAKITTNTDLTRANQLMNVSLRPHIGTGFDVHRFGPGDHVILGGVKIPHTHALAGHSDADVVLHALTDAVLGALGDGDIGQHFPPSDPQWKGAASHIFLEDAVARVAARGGLIVNADVTVMCEAPKIGPHRDAIKTRVAAIMALDPANVGIKATTTEGLGFTGRREGIAATASVMLLMS